MTLFLLNKRFFLTLAMYLSIAYLPDFIFMGLLPLLGFRWSGGGDWFVITLMGACLALAIIVCNLLGLFAKSNREQKTRRILICAAVLVLFIPAAILSSNLRSYAFYMAGERAMPIVDAVEEYVRDTGNVPRDIQSLMPIYLEKIPKRVPPLKIQEGSDNSWRIIADVSIGILNWDEFMYLSDTHYLKKETSRSFESLGNGWYYYHE